MNEMLTITSRSSTLFSEGMGPADAITATGKKSISNRRRELLRKNILENNKAIVESRNCIFQGWDGYRWNILWRRVGNCLSNIVQLLLLYKTPRGTWGRDKGRDPFWTFITLFRIWVQYRQTVRHERLSEFSHLIASIIRNISIQYSIASIIQNHWERRTKGGARFGLPWRYLPSKKLIYPFIITKESEESELSGRVRPRSMSNFSKDRHPKQHRRKSAAINP